MVRYPSLKVVDAWIAWLKSMSLKVACQQISNALGAQNLPP